VIVVKQMVVPWTGCIVALDDGGRMWYTTMRAKCVDDYRDLAYEINWKPLEGPSLEDAIRNIPRP